jgi:prepilin-type N-terminal cleavage/methylation domain-containing protein
MKGFRFDEVSRRGSKMNEMKKKQNGFSLTEVMVTLSILAVGLLTIAGLLRLAQWRLIY